MPTYSPLIRLPFAVGGAGLGTIASADMRPMFAPAPETDAVAHWDLGVTAASLADLLGGRALTPVGTAPTFDAFGMKMPDGAINGLRTDIADKANAFTIALVAQVPTSVQPGNSQSSIIYGTLQPGGSGDGLGGGAFIQGGASGQASLSFQDNQRNAGASQNSPVNISNIVPGTTWFFYLMSMAADGSRFQYIPGANNPLTLSNAITKTPSTRKLALGNADYPQNGWYNGLRVSEFIVWDRGLTQAEAAAVAQRSRARLAYRKQLTFLGG